jgi:ubiquinone/menaquinone biosynthesis C-methylase UbiE
MSRFGSDPRAFFDSVYLQTPPWDVGGPQPALCALFDEYPPKGPALDLGCGSGDLAIALARRGVAVLGVDFVDAAIAQARQKAKMLPAEAAQRLSFEVADALQPSRLRRQFASVLDCGFLHLLEPAQLPAFIDELTKTLRPGGRYYVLAFATEFPPPSPRQVTEEELRARFVCESGWRILALRRTVFESRIAPVPAVCACIER